MAKSLKKWIDELVDALGGANKPTLPQIRSKLVKFSALAEKSEQGEAISESEAKIASLEAALEESNTKNAELDISLKEAKAEINRFRAEEKEREKQEADLPEIQLRILRRLPTEHGGRGLTREAIFLYANIPADEAEIHMDRLEESGLIESYKVGVENDFGALGMFLTETLWRRSKAGNKLVVSKRLAGEEEGEDQERSNSDLTQAEERILRIIAKNRGATVSEIVDSYNKAMPSTGKPFASAPMVRLLLGKLRRKNMAEDKSERWNVLTPGINYLIDRGLT